MWTDTVESAPARSRKVRASAQALIDSPEIRRHDLVGT